MIDDNELNALIEDAEKLGYGNKELLLNRLMRMISANKDYLEYRRRRGRTGRYNESVAEDMLALAMAVKLLSE
jgi:hypothetical protein